MSKINLESNVLPIVTLCALAGIIPEHTSTAERPYSEPIKKDPNFRDTSYPDIAAQRNYAQRLGTQRRGR